MKRQLASIAVLIICLAFLLPQIDWNEFFYGIRNLDPVLIGAGIMLKVMQIVFMAIRWNLLINLDRGRISAPRMYRISLLASMSNVVFLAAVSGIALRLILSIRAGVPWIKAACATFADRMFSVGVLFLIAYLMVPFTFIHLVSPEQRHVLLLLCAMVAITLIAGIYTVFKYPFLFKAVIGKQKYQVLMTYLARLFRPRNFMTALFLSVAGQMSFFTAVYFILHASGGQASFGELMIVLPMMSILASLPVSIGGWGIREGAFVVGLGMLGIKAEIALLVSVQVGLYSMLAAVLMGLPCLLDRQLHDDFGKMAGDAKHILRRIKNRVA